jgi:hypothetical protein
VLTEQDLEALRAIGQSGAIEQKIASAGIDAAVLAGLVGQGYARVDEIVLRETAPPGLARQSHAAVRTWQLTAAGAQAIGIDPDRLGMA